MATCYAAKSSTSLNIKIKEISRTDHDQVAKIMQCLH